jgi:hypothetical protein
MPVKKSNRRRKSSPMNKSALVKQYKRLTAGMDKSAVAAVMAIGAMAAAMLIALAWPSQPAAATSENRFAAASTAAEFDEPFEAADATEARAPQSALVTITGCLERDDETFRLKDTAGADAPRSRSWKSGFLKKRNSSVEVIDASNRLRLNNHVGERISVTGTLEDKELQVRSLRRVASSCADDTA